MSQIIQENNPNFVGKSIYLWSPFKSYRFFKSKCQKLFHIQE